MLDLTSPAYTRLATGTKISALFGVPTIDDMAIQLPRELRYAGGSKEPWPVALHTFVVCDLTPGPYKIYSLIHDSPEVAGGDCPRPFKPKELRTLEDCITDRTCAAHGLHILTPEEKRIIKNADNMALMGEIYTIGPPGLEEDYVGVPRVPEAEQLVLKYLHDFHILECMRADGAAGMEFRRRFQEYMGIYRFEHTLRPIAFAKLSDEATRTHA